MDLNQLHFAAFQQGVFNFPQQKAAEIAIKTVKDYLNEKEFESMNIDCQELLALLISSIKTTKQNNEMK